MNKNGKVTDDTIEILLMKTNKAPGPDSITVEFYRTFWPLIGNVLLKVYNETLIDEELPHRQNMSVISLIFSKVIATIINTDLSGFIKSHFIGNNIRLTVDILEYSEVKQCGGALIILNFTKAFDSRNRDFLFYTLDKFNFGPTF
jgi:hypothetical protein